MKVSNRKIEGVCRACPYCGVVINDMERYGNHVRDCKKTQ